MKKKAETPAVEKTATVAEKPAETPAETPAVEKTATVAEKPAETAKTLKIEITKPFIDKVEDVSRNAGDIVNLETERAKYIVSQGFAVIVK